jgi:NTP pyrophosphatase (non-canonical NTP hydrolase)
LPLKKLPSEYRGAKGAVIRGNPRQNKRSLKMGLNKMAKEIHANAQAKGFWYEQRNKGELIALIHSELSEALECLRRNEAEYYKENGKPEGVVSELADVVIRVLDMCGAYNYDIEKAVNEKIAYNKSRPMMHGKKF